MVIIDDGSGLGTIVNDDTAQLSIDDVSLVEGDAGNTAFIFTISSDLQSSKDLGVTVNTNDLLDTIAIADLDNAARFAAEGVAHPDPRAATEAAA